MTTAQARTGIAEVNGVSLHYDVQGTGAPLLLITGLGQHSGVWAGVLPVLSENFTCITFDNRGTGRSSVPDAAWSIDDMGDDTAALLEHLDVGPVHALGWSLGGSVLQSLLVRHGDRLRRAVLLSAFPSYTGVQDAWLDTALVLRRSGADPVTMAISGMPWGFTPRALSDHAATLTQAELLRADPYPTSYEGFARQAAGLRVFDSRPGLPSASTPTLVLTGAEDVLTPVSQAVEMASLLAQATLQVLPRGGHGMLLEYPDDVLRAVQRFLRADPGAPLPPVPSPAQAGAS